MAERVVLPTNVVPKRYILSFKPNLEAFTFEGTAAIHLDVTQKTSSICLNAAELKLSQETNIEIVDDGRRVALSSITYNEQEEQCTLNLSEELVAGIKIVLHTSFTGELNDKLRGFYRSKYTLPSGETRFMATTQMEACDCRRAFPCWDEPNKKAIFEVTLIVPAEKTALSNMPEKSSSVHADGLLKTVQFEPTPLMSTYLVAFTVGDLECLEARIPESGLLVRAFTTPGKKDQAQFALSCALRAVPFYDSWFGSPYQLPKLDMIAIPDFAAGAMENWGLVTYRETCMLIDPKNSSQTTKQYVAIVVAHEIAHSWFGNLVTMDWWDNLWLNESFATWMETECVDFLFPEWKIWTQFIQSDFMSALSLDALENSHPIEVTVNHPSEIDEIFDMISYQKGGSVMKMLQGFLTPSVFQKGLQIYLKRHAYGNATSEDLWNAFSEASGEDVARLMDAWTHKTGFPVITLVPSAAGGAEAAAAAASSSPSARHGHRCLCASQSRFFALPKVQKSAEESQSQIAEEVQHDYEQKLKSDAEKWIVPLSMIRSSEPSTIVPLPQLTPSSAVSGDFVIDAQLDSNSWVKLNAGQTGFYRVNYTPELWKSLSEAIRARPSPLSAVDRLGLQSDAWALARSGLVPTSTALDVLASFKGEMEYICIADLNSNVTELQTLLADQGDEVQAKLSAFVRSLFSEAGALFGWDVNEQDERDPLAPLIRPVLVGKLGANGHEATLEEARRRFNLFVTDRSALAADLRRPVYSIVMRNGGEKEFEQLLEVYRTSSMTEEKVRVLRALGAAPTPDLVKRALAFSLSEEVRSQDILAVIGTAASTRTGRHVTWQWFKETFDVLIAKFGKGGFILPDMVSSFGSFNTEEMAQEVSEFLTSHPVPSAERTSLQVVEGIRSNAQWLQRDQQNILDWLNTNF